MKKDGEQNIDFTVNGTYEGYMIAPMLFIPFFENVFKHGNLSDTRQGWMRSHMNVQESRIDFTIENSYNNTDFKKQLGGVGLENIKQRLSLIYPEQHQLSIQVKEAVFSVELIISLVNQKYEVSMLDR